MRTREVGKAAQGIVLKIMVEDHAEAALVGVNEVEGTPALTNTQGPGNMKPYRRHQLKELTCKTELDGVHGVGMSVQSSCTSTGDVETIR
jgi:hypothetical protein